MRQESVDYRPDKLETQGNTVLVFRDLFGNSKDGKPHLSNPTFMAQIRSLGFDPVFLAKLLKGEHTQWEKEFLPERFPEEDPVEEYVVREARTADGTLIEVTETKGFGSYTPWVHLNNPHGIQFEAIFVIKTEGNEGTLIYRFPKAIKPVAAGVYAAAEEEEEIIELREGDLVIIPVSTGRSIDMVGTVKYTYVGPTWKETPPVPVY